MLLWVRQLCHYGSTDALSSSQCGLEEVDTDPETAPRIPAIAPTDRGSWTDTPYWFKLRLKISKDLRIFMRVVKYAPAERAAFAPLLGTGHWLTASLM